VTEIAKEGFQWQIPLLIKNSPPIISHTTVVHFKSNYCRVAILARSHKKTWRSLKAIGQIDLIE